MSSFPLPQRVDSRRRRRKKQVEAPGTLDVKQTQALGAETSDTKKAEAVGANVGSKCVITDIPGGSSYLSPKFEFTNDHPADVQLHAWGDDLKESFEQIAISLFAYETTLDNVELLQKYAVEAEGHDMLSLLYNYMNEFLYLFSGEGIVCQHIYIYELQTKEKFHVKAFGYGEPFSIKKHSPVGTEVKAITYSHMQIYSNDEVVGNEHGKQNSSTAKTEFNQDFVGARTNAPSEIYVIVDI